jgi:hypothetical protein
MSDRYLLMLQSYAARDATSMVLAAAALGFLVWWLIVETSPFLSVRRPFWRNMFWGLTLGTYVLGMAAMTRIPVRIP